MVAFSRFAPGLPFSNVYLLFGSFEDITFHQFLEHFSLNFGSFLPSWVAYAPRDLEIALALLIWTQNKPKLAPSWLRLCPCWPQVGSNLFPGPQLPLGQPKPFQTPSLWPLGLPNPQLRPTRPKIHPKKASQTYKFNPQPPT